MPVRREIGFNTLRWILNGQYEQGEINIIKEHLVAGEKVLEIGTGLGFISAFSAKRTGSDNVFTFEANPSNAATAKEVFKKNHVYPAIENLMLGAGGGQVDFPINKKSRLASSLKGTDTDTVSIRTEDLNETIKIIRPDFLIMDIEGAEYDIFRIIRYQTIKKIQFELHPQILGETKCNEIFAILAKSNFIKHPISDDRNFYYYLSVPQ